MRENAVRFFGMDLFSALFSKSPVEVLSDLGVSMAMNFRLTSGWLSVLLSRHA